MPGGQLALWGQQERLISPLALLPVAVVGALIICGLAIGDLALIGAGLMAPASVDRWEGLFCPAWIRGLEERYVGSRAVALRLSWRQRRRRCTRSSLPVFEDVARICRLGLLWVISIRAAERP